MSIRNETLGIDDIDRVVDPRSGGHVRKDALMATTSTDWAMLSSP